MLHKLSELRMGNFLKSFMQSIASLVKMYINHNINRKNLQDAIKVFNIDKFQWPKNRRVNFVRVI